MKGLIYNAGIQHRQPLIEFDLEDFDRMLDNNLRTSFLLSREAVRLMQCQRFGSIVNIDSILGPQPHKTITATLRAKLE